MTTGAHSTRRTRSVPYKQDHGIKHGAPNSEINVTPLVDVCLVLGSTNSSNSNRLRELAEKQGVSAYLIDGAEDIGTGRGEASSDFHESIRRREVC